MPASPRDALILRSPDALVCALPYLVGFVPTQSIVLIWVAHGRVLLTQRMDLPPGEPPEEYMAVMWGHEPASAASEVIACVLDPGPSVFALVDAFVLKAEKEGVSVRDVIVVEDSRWRSLLCRDEECCPPEGRTPDPSARSLVAAEFAVLGVAPRHSRADVEEEIDRDVEGMQRLQPDVVEALAIRAASDREQWRDDVSAFVGSTLLAVGLAREVGQADLARVIVGLADVRVRDTFLWDSMRADDEQLHAALTILQHATRVAPDDVVAPAATCAAILWWVSGDGARASISVERALACDPEYSLAVLVLAALRAGLPPATWREAMNGLTREDCRVRRDAA